jgi:hypothetical protein
MLTAYRGNIGPVPFYDKAKARKAERETVDIEMLETMFRQERDERIERKRQRRLARSMNKPLPKLPSSANLNKPLPPLPACAAEHGPGQSTMEVDGPFVNVDLHK